MDVFNIFIGETDEPATGANPDSDEVGVWANGTYCVLRRSEHLDYRDGER